MIVFDMNETTLDLVDVRAAVDSFAAEAGGFTSWFQRLLQSAMTISATESDFVAFSDLARNAFDATLGRTGRALTDAEWTVVSDAMAHLRPHPDARPGLERLRSCGHATMALTNSGQSSLETTCAATGLDALFDHLVSVEAVQVYKPFPLPYRHAAEIAGMAPSEMWMVACHDWDLAGAKAAGLQTAFVERPGFSLSPSYPRPDISVPDFNALTDALC